MHYLIFGAGAVGSFLGGRLALSGHQSTFLARSRVASAFRTHGLRMTDGRSHELLPIPDVIDNPQQAFSPTPPDVIFLTVKTYDVETAAKQILEFSPCPIPVFCFTNGIGSEATLSELLKGFPIIPATLTSAVQLTSDGIVQVERERGVGIADAHPIAHRVLSDLIEADMTVRKYGNANRMKWSKLLTNIVSNASSAILGWPPARIFQHPGLYRIEVEALREAVRLMRAKGIRPQNLPGVPTALLSLGIFLPTWMTQKILGRIVSRGRGDKLPSFHYDIGRGQSEIHHLNGAVVKAGEEIGLPTPANRFLTETMLTIVKDASKHKALQNHPDEFLKLAIKAGVPEIQGYNP